MRFAVAAGLGLLGLGIVTACNGQGTGTLNPLDTNDPTPSSYEKPTSGTDPVGSSNDPSGAGAESVPLCQGAPTSTTSCLSCAGSSCSTALADAVSACNAYLKCFSQCACTDETCITTCEGNITSDCETAVGPLEACASTSCESECSSSVSVSFGGDAGSSMLTGGNKPGSGSTAPSGGGSGCSSLSSCCGTLSGAEETECNTVVSDNDDTACTDLIGDLQTAGQCN